jgi:acetolactate decarboxylase
MKNVMWKGQLYGTINLDTIANKTHLYGLGPVEYLQGEILILDGVCYKSTVVDDTTMRVEQTFRIQAPFMGYANIASWRAIPLPKNIQTLSQLENYLLQHTKAEERPLMFKISGIVDSASIHIVNLAKGSVVHCPDDAHKGQKNYEINHEKVEILGFFSTDHQTIFTHHDTYLHMHLITHDKSKMGHLDSVKFASGQIILYLPIQVEEAEH